MSFNNNIILNKFLENIGRLTEKDIYNNEEYNTNNLNISEKINDENNTNILFYIFLFIIIFVFIGKFEIKLNHIFSLIIFLIFFNYLLNHNLNNKKEYINDKKNEIEFLNEYLFNNQKHLNYNLPSKLYSNKKLSYFYLDPYLVDFLYSLKELVNYNADNYGELLLHCNNILMLKNDTKLGLQNIGHNYQNAYIEKNKALNALEGLIISIPNNSIFDKKIENSVNLLHSILNIHLNYILNFIKIEHSENDYNINDIPLDLLKSESIINPFNKNDNIHEFFNT